MMAPITGIFSFGGIMTFPTGTVLSPSSSINETLRFAFMWLTMNVAVSQNLNFFIGDR